MTIKQAMLVLGAGMLVAGVALALALKEISPGNALAVAVMALGATLLLGVAMTSVAKTEETTTTERPGSSGS